MNARQSNASSTNPFLLWGTFGLKAMQMSTAAAQVIAIRTTRMAKAGLNPSAADQREMTLMGAEKVDAFSRAGQALAAGAVPLFAGMAGHAFRTGLDVFNATAKLAASRSIPQTLAGQRLLAQNADAQRASSAARRCIESHGATGASRAGAGARQGHRQR